MNLTFYVVVIAFIFALFYLCSRESTDEEDGPSTNDDCEMRTPSCHIDMNPESHLQRTHSLMRRPPPEPGNPGIPNNICPPSYEQVIRNEDFYSMNKTKNNPQLQLAQ